MTTVFVTNTSDIILTDGWDGVSYTFEPGKTIEVPEFVATHIFGYKEKDVAPKLARLGWAATLNDLEQGKQKSIHLIEYDDLMNSPEETMKQVYEFLGEEYFEHDFKNIEK